MAKIIALDNQIVSIGVEGGGIKEVRTSDLSFVPHVGDEVEIFETETKTIVSKVEPKKTEIPNGGININLSNSQNTVPNNTYVAMVNGKVVNKVVYCVLAFLLGGLGAHKFYAGKIGAGITYVLFCWTGIPLIISIIELIAGLCKKSDAAGNIVV